MPGDPWVDEALKTTRTAHRFFIGVAVASLSAFIPSLTAKLPNWDDEKRKLERHIESIEPVLERELDTSLSTARITNPPDLDTACMRVGDRSLSLADWRDAARRMRVSQIQGLNRVELFELPPRLDAYAVSFDCVAQLAWVTADPMDAGQPIELVPRTIPIEVPPGLTVMNAHADYAAIKDATIDDMLEVVKVKTLQARNNAKASLPVSTPSLLFVGLTLIVLMIHLVAHMNRLREMAKAGHAQQIIAFSWIMTMNSRRARAAINLFTWLLVTALIVSAVYDVIRAEYPYTGDYSEPGPAEFGVGALVVISLIWMIVSNVQLQLALPVTTDFYKPPAPKLNETGNLPVRTEPALPVREHLLARLETLDAPLIVLTGPSGVGKTELALDFGRRQQASYPDGVFVIDAQVDIATQLSEFVLAQPLETPLGAPARAQEVRYVLAQKRCLLIYDHVESFEQLRPWLPPSGHSCRVLVTSTNGEWREPFKVESIPPLTPEETNATWPKEELPLDPGKTLYERTGGNLKAIIAAVREWTNFPR